MAQWLSEKMGQKFIVENLPGAGNNIGTEAVVTAPTDGYTMLFVNPAHSINASLYKKLPFNFIRDITPVAGMVRTPNVMTVTNALPVKNRGRVHRLLQSQPKQGQHGLIRQRHLDPPLGRAARP